MPKQTLTSKDGSLPNTHLIPHSPALNKLLLKPSKSLLCEIAINWLNNPQFGTPHPPSEDLEDGEVEDEDGIAQMGIEELKRVYEKMKTAGSVTRKAVVDRITGRHWVG